MLLAIVAGTCVGAEAAASHAGHTVPIHRAGEHAAEHNRFDIHALSCNVALASAQGAPLALPVDACVETVPPAAETPAGRPGLTPTAPYLARALGPPAFLRHAALLI